MPNAVPGPTVQAPCMCEGRIVDCEHCSGTGAMTRPSCRTCGGTGHQGVTKCLDCRGEGWRDVDTL